MIVCKTGPSYVKMVGFTLVTVYGIKLEHGKNTDLGYLIASYEIYVFFKLDGSLYLISLVR